MQTADKKMAPAGRVRAQFMASIVAGRRALAMFVLLPGPVMSAVAKMALVLTLSVALTGCAWLQAKQSQLALRPTPGRPAGLPDDSVLFRPGDQRWLAPVLSTSRAQTQQLALWWLPSADPQAPTLLYLPGTFRNLYRNLPKINALRDAGFSVLAVDYRGWGDSTVIVPDEETIAADARVAWVELQRRQPDPRRRVLFGHSMGGAVAVRLASTLRGSAGAGTLQDYAALVLESTFTRLPDVASQAGFIGRLAAGVTTLEFNSLARISRVDAPVLMLHGDADSTVPVQLGRALRDAALQAAATRAEAAPPLRWVEFAGGTHSRLHAESPAAYTQVMRDLIQRLGSGPALAIPPMPEPRPTPRTP